MENSLKFNESVAEVLANLKARVLTKGVELIEFEYNIQTPIEHDTEAEEYTPGITRWRKVGRITVTLSLTMDTHIT